ncbi:MAG: phage terminase large subunit family protein, partial [Betaproteobacteria bacterium]|nr:phage terminase large subunit family protein [Betaproteobacteria bacterium]
AGKVDIDWKGRLRKNGLVLWHVGTNHAKDMIHGRLQITRPGPGYIHFSNELSDEWFRQFTGEARTTRRASRGDESVWTPIRKRIETWDCAVYVAWLEAYFDLGKKSAKFWNELESQVQPPTIDLFASTDSAATQENTDPFTNPIDDVREYPARRFKRTVRRLEQPGGFKARGW